MPSLNYQKRFAQDVDEGRKRQTIRAMRKIPFKVGDRLHHFTGQRTVKCKRLRKGIEDYAKEVHLFEMDGEDEFYMDGFQLGFLDCIVIVHQDGFETMSEMVDWFQKTHGLPFRGQLIRW